MHAGHALNADDFFHVCFSFFITCHNFLACYLHSAIRRRRNRFRCCLRVLGLEPAQAQRIAHHKHRAEAHRERAEHRVHLELEVGVEHARRDGNADGVVEERPEEVFLDVADDRAAQLHGGRDVEKITAHQHNIRRLDGDVRTGTDGNADVCARKGGRIVDAVADHGDLLAALL